MPIEYRIHKARRIVLMRAHGVLADHELFAYQREVWSRPEVAGFDELVEMDDVVRINQPDPERVRELANLSASMDAPGTTSKFAIVASDRLAFGLAQMYGARRDFNAKSSKEVRVFQKRAAALEWLEVTEEELAAEGVREGEA
jgi:hypothetical protein